MSIHKIDLDKTGYFSSSFLEYVSASERLTPFFNATPDPESFSSVIKERNFPVESRKVLKEVIELNPLYRSVELYHKEGDIARQEVEVKEAYLTLRVEAPVNVKYLNIVSKYGGYQYLLELL